MIFYLGNKVDDLVDEKIRLNRNTLKSWKYGYHKDLDLIVISKDGTLGTIFNINGLNIGLPEPPKDRKDIFNWDKTDKNQRWKRTPYPKGLNEKTQYNPEYNDFIMEQIRRRNEGFWIYIKGELIYLPGNSYFFLDSNNLDEGYPDFRVIQNELQIYKEACIADRRSYGIIYVKNRRFGWTAICNGEELDAGTSNSNKLLGIISKTGADSKKMFRRLVNTFKKLPVYYKPSTDSSTSPKTELIFSEQTRKRRKENEEKIVDEGLETIINWQNTVLNSYDGDKLFRLSADEGSKYPKDCRFDQYWRIVKTSLRQGKRIVGKALVGSTVNAMKKGGAEFKKVYMQSNPLQRNKNDQTVSGLYWLFISAEYGLEGFYDTYGFSIVEDPKTRIKTDLGEWTTIGSRTYLENELEALKDDPEAYNEQLRQFPRNINEAFRDESSDCNFNLVKILEQSEYNEEESNHNEYGSDEIERGNLVWKDGVQDSEVVWKPDPLKGRFWIKKGCHPPLEFRNKKEMKKKNGVLAWSPTASHIGSIGADPYNRTKSADGRGSLGSLSLTTKTNTSTLPNEDMIVEYIDRAKKVEYFFEDAILLCVYYSIPLLGELSNEAFLKHFKNRGYRHFSLNNPFKTFKELSYTERELGGAPPQNSKIADQQFYAVEAYVEDYIGVARDDSVRPNGEIGKFVFNRTLEQIKDVDLENRTKYDAYISFSLSLIANQRRVKVEKVIKPFTNPFTKYDNRKFTSKAI